MFPPCLASSSLRVERGIMLTLVLISLFPLFSLIMALSPQDQAFYEDKLSLKSFGYLFGATVIIGAVAWPLLMFFQDWSHGLAGRWNAQIIFDFSAVGFLLGSVVAVVMYLLFKLFLEMGWLPKRR